MQIHKVQPNTFEAKQRFVSQEIRADMKYLLERMNEGTTYSDNGNWFKTTIFKEISDKKGNIRFQDGRIYIGNKINKKDLKGDILLTIGKTELVIDNQSGEIKDFYKPFFTTWNYIMKKINKSVEFFKENFDNEDLVKHKKLSMQGFTEKGHKEYEKLKAGVNG